MSNPAFFKTEKTARAKWMGIGAYFFQDTLGHACAWASQCSRRRRNETLIVAKATIELDGAVDLIDNRHWRAIEAVIKKGSAAPRSQVGPIAIVDPNYTGDISDLYNNHEDDFHLTRYVDLLETQGFAVPAIRGAFIEGKPVHPTSWLYDEAHVQICVRDPKVIQAVEWLEL